MQKEPTAKLSLDQLKEHPDFARLGQKQQNFLLIFITTGNRLEAVRQSYGELAKPENAATRCLQNGFIKRLLALYYGQESDQSVMSRSELGHLIAARLRNPKTADSDFWRFAALMINLRFKSKGQKLCKHPGTDNEDSSTVAVEEPEAEIADVNTLVRRMEAERRTTA